MKKLSLILILAFLIAPLSVFAEEVSLNEFESEEVFYRETFDNLVLDFTVEADDTLDTVVIKSNGTARTRHEIDKLILWTDTGTEGFDGFAIDTELAEGELDENNWVFDELDYTIDGEQRFFVTVETGRTTDNSRWFEYCLTSYDADEDGVYDSGDLGIFLSSGIIETDEICGESAVYRSRGWESEVVMVVDNLDDEQVIDVENYIITGKSRVQGGYGVSSMSICIDDVCEAVESTEGNHEEWEYEWNNLEEGEYEIYFKAESTSGAWSFGDTMSVVVDFGDEEMTEEDEGEAEEVDVESQENEGEDTDDISAKPVLSGVEVLDDREEPFIKRNLEAEAASLPVVARILGHLPNSDRDWKILHYLVYGMTVPENVRNLSWENYALGEFGKMYGEMPKTAYDWNVIRVLSYTGSPHVILGR